MNSRVLLVLLFLAIVGTTWLLVKLVQLPPPEGREGMVQDTAAVADRKAVVNPFARPAGEGGDATLDSLQRDSTRMETDTTSNSTADSDEAALGGTRP